LIAQNGKIIMSLDFQTVEHDRHIVITLEGRLDALSHNALDDELERVISGGNTRIILDCPQLRFVSSAGLRVLLKAVKKIGQEGRLVLSGATENVVSVLEMSGFDRFINNCSDLVSAQASFD
jgi:anti-anti-sigma factor